MLSNQQQADDGLAHEIRATHRQAMKAGNAFINYALQVGEMLNRAKTARQHGTWLAFVEKCSTADCPMTLRQAQRYMKASRDFSRLPDTKRMSFLESATGFEDLRGLLSAETKRPRTTLVDSAPPPAEAIEEVAGVAPVEPSHVVEADPDPADLPIETEPAEPTDVQCSRCGGCGRVSITAQMPAVLAQSTEFVNTWQDYQLFRIEKRSKLTTVGISRLFKKLESWGADKATKALEITMENGWTGVFEPNQNDRSSDDPRGNMATLEAYIAEL